MAGLIGNAFQIKPLVHVSNEAIFADEILTMYILLQFVFQCDIKHALSC